MSLESTLERVAISAERSELLLAKVLTASKTSPKPSVTRPMNPLHVRKFLHLSRLHLLKLPRLRRLLRSRLFP